MEPDRAGGTAAYSACVVNHEGAVVLAATLEAVLGLRPPPAEVVLVDNASGDGSVELARRAAPGLRVVRLAANAGPGPARDAGYRAARCRRVLLLDNDVRPEPDCAAMLSAALDRHPGAAFAMARVCHAAAPGTVQFDGAGAHVLGMMALENAEAPLADAPTAVREIGSLVTACFMVDRARWGEEPLCDPRFFFHFEDHELGLRARLLGHRLLAVPAARCLHGTGTAGISLRATGRFGEVRSLPHGPQPLADPPQGPRGAHPPGPGAGPAAVRAAPARGGRAQGLAPALAARRRLDPGQRARPRPAPPRPPAAAGAAGPGAAERRPAPVHARAPRGSRRARGRGPAGPRGGGELGAGRPGAAPPSGPDPGRMSGGARLGRDLAVSLAAQAAYKLLNLAVLALLARRLAPEVAGAWFYALAVTAAAGPLTDLGTSDLTTRAIAADPRRAGERAGALLATRLPLLLAFVLLVPALGALVAPDALPYLLVATLYAALTETWRSLAAVFAGLRRVDWTVLGFGGSLALLLPALAGATSVAPSLPALALAYLASGLLAAGVGLHLLRRALGPGAARFWPPRPPALVARSWRLFALGSAAVLHLKLGSLLLGPLAGYPAVAAYEVGGRLVEASQFLTRPVTLVVFPACAALAAAGDVAGVRRLAAPALGAALLLGIGLAALGSVAAPRLGSLLLGAGYPDAAPLLRRLMLAVPGLLLGGTATLLAMALHLERRALTLAAGSLALHAALAAALVPAYGARGAAAALAVALGTSALGTTLLCLRALRGSVLPVPGTA